MKHLKNVQLSKAVAKSRPQRKGVEGLFEGMLLLLLFFAQFHGKRRERERKPCLPCLFIECQNMAKIKAGNPSARQANAKASRSQIVCPAGGTSITHCPTERSKYDRGGPTHYSYYKPHVLSTYASSGVLPARRFMHSVLSYFHFVVVDQLL